MHVHACTRAHTSVHATANVHDSEVTPSPNMIHSCESSSPKVGTLCGSCIHELCPEHARSLSARAVLPVCRYQVEREMRIHIQLDHVNIIKLYAAFEDDKNVYMVQVRSQTPMRSSLLIGVLCSSQNWQHLRHWQK